MTDLLPPFGEAEVKPGAILDAHQIRDERLVTMANTFQGADRIISGYGVNIRLVTAGTDVPVAWTDGETIFFNADRLTEVDFDTIVEVYGVNFHEVCHILWGPRKGSTIVGFVITHKFEVAFNILEDQRIESLMVARYPSVQAWLTTAITKWVIQSEQFNPEHGYLFVRGRRYLDGRMRGALRALFGRPDLLPEVDRIIDRYRQLIFPTDYVEAQQLIKDFNDLLADLLGKQPLSSCPHGHGHRQVEILIKGRPKGLSEQRRTRDRMQEGEPEPDLTIVIDLDPEDENDGEGDEGEGDDAGEGDTDPAKNGKRTVKVNVTSTTPVGGRKAGTEARAKEIIDLVAKEVMQNVLNDKEVKADVRRTLRQIKGGTGSDVIERTKWTLKDPMREYAHKYGAMHRMLRKLAMEAEPGWIDREEYGRVNPLRWAREQDPETAFDAWDEGVNDAVDMEVFIALDESGSMGNQYIEAANAMWVVKRALDKIGASCTVTTFSDRSTVLYHREEKATAQFRYSFHGGGTSPVMAMGQAARIFARSQKSQKILIVFTDGEWSGLKDDDGVDADEWIKRMNRGGVLTALGFIHDPTWFRNGAQKIQTHGCQLHRGLDVNALVPFMQNIVVNVIRQRLVLR